MITTTHPSPSDLLWYAVTSDEDDTRVRAVRHHLAAGCELCISAVRRLQETAAERPFAGTSVLQPGWIVPRRVVVTNGRGSLADLHLICGAGPYELDILMREAPRELEMTGQVTRAGRIFEPVARLPLMVVETPSVMAVASTETDSFGEFDLASPRDGRYGVRLGEGDDAPCVLVWDGEES